MRIQNFWFKKFAMNFFIVFFVFFFFFFFLLWLYIFLLSLTFFERSSLLILVANAISLLFSTISRLITLNLEDYQRTNLYFSSSLGKKCYRKQIFILWFLLLFIIFHFSFLVFVIFWTFLFRHSITCILFQIINTIIALKRW